jgi:hypothetical protein
MSIRCNWLRSPMSFSLSIIEPRPASLFGGIHECVYLVYVCVGQIPRGRFVSSQLLQTSMCEAMSMVNHEVKEFANINVAGHTSMSLLQMAKYLNAFCR